MSSTVVRLKKDVSILTSVLSNPEVCFKLDEKHWGILLRQARSANVLGRTLQAVDRCLPEIHWPPKLSQAYCAEKNLAAHRKNCLRWELETISSLHLAMAIRPVLLKGAAYLASGFEFAKYRIFGDIDILVPHADLAKIEKCLMIDGWVTTKKDLYDQNYYRRWMHELPPMCHIHRGTTLDVHHGIVPRTARYKPKPELLVENVRPVLDMPTVDVFSVEDMYLHAAVHLFTDGDGLNAFRNLLDLHDLLIICFQGKNFSLDNLVDRSINLDLVIPLVFSGRYLERIFSLEVAAALNRRLIEREMMPRAMSFWDVIFDPIFLGFATFDPLRKLFAQEMLLIRGHFLRMPMTMLLPHLLRKAIRSKDK